MSLKEKRGKKKKRIVTISSLLKLALFLGYLYILLFVTLEIAETHYFDRLFFQKSWIHGYFFPEKDSQNTLAKLLAGVNSDGFRDREFRPKRKDEFLILVVGDSNVWGWGVRERHRFTNILEKELSKIRKTRVISLGKGGNNLFLNQNLAHEYETRLKPDLVVFTFYENDLLIRPEQEELIDKLTDDHYAIVREFHRGETLENYHQRVLGSYDSSAANLQAFFKIIPSLDKHYLYYYLSYFHQEDHGRLTQEVMKNKGLHVINNNILYRLKYAALASNTNNKENESLEISQKEGHPNQIAHLMFAERLFAEITCNPDLGFSQTCGIFNQGRIKLYPILN
jgi:hypothetical protein